MAWSQIAKVGASSAAGQDITSGSIDTSGANTLFAFVSDYGAVAKSTFSDSKSNTWTELTEQNVGAFTRGRWLYAKNATVGTGHTFTAATGGTGKYPSFRAYAYSGGDTTAPFDVENGATALAASSVQTGSVTPSVNDELILAGVAFGAVLTYTINSGFSAVDEQNFSPGAAFGSATATLVQTTAGAVNPTWSNGGSDAMAACIATFKAGAGGPTTAQLSPAMLQELSGAVLGRYDR